MRTKITIPRAEGYPGHGEPRMTGSVLFLGLAGSPHPVSMAALTLKFAPMQNGPTVRNQLRRCTYSGDSPSKYHLVIAPA